MLQASVLYLRFANYRIWQVIPTSLFYIYKLLPSISMADCKSRPSL